MTPLERYLAVCNGELPDRAPVSPFIMQFAAQVAGVSYRDYCLSGEVMAHAQMTCAKRFGYDSVNVTSLGGSVTLRENATFSNSTGATPLLQAWLNNVLLFNNSGTQTVSYFQPWLRLDENSVSAFSTSALMKAAARASQSSWDFG